ncbi:MAG: molybdenum cofactor biosynthesis protein MoaB [Phycisphaerales bacterium]|nr:molybdenum cofactor biosynthesis protein MoaB [Planctomycetota bacterium]MBL6997567.1 molybdenum cofactor biosynthesis protein MoaB [Phycisphaerales bacterium]
MKHGSSKLKAVVNILTVSDTRSLEDDKSGSLAVTALEQAGHSIASREIVRDELGEIAAIISAWAGDAAVDAIVVTGGTGPARRDVTPEAISPLMTATMPGFGELFRQLSYEEIGAAAMLSRADAGWIDTDNLRTPVFMLPGSPNAVSLAMQQLIIPQLAHLLDVCSLEPKT